MKNKIKIAVLMGGKSSEREVSMSSGKEVLANIDRKKYFVTPIEIPLKGNGWVDKLLKIKPDVVFIALHGDLGEDGAMQGMLEEFGIPYTGCGVLASALGMDKILFKRIMRQEKILIPKDVVNAPCFVKPGNQGSSVGASLVLVKKDLNKAIKLAKKYSENILIEEYVKGVELTCGVLGNRDLEALPVVEIIPKGKYFDYNSKYKKGGSEEIVPARISKPLTKKVQELAIKVYKTVGARGFARIDFILKNNKLFVLEINTIPGLTPMSLLPKEAKAIGISYSVLIDKIIKYALE